MAEEQPQNKKEKISRIYDKYFKIFLLVPIIFLLFSLIYMGIFYNKNKDFIHKDISLTGGSFVTIYDKVDIGDLRATLSEKIGDFNIREIYDLVTKEQKAVIIETKLSGSEIKKILEEFLGYELNNENSSFEFTGSNLSGSFYKQLLIAILIAFLFMAVVVFVIFRKFVPSFVVILSAFADILMTLTLVNILGIKMSSAGIIAFLMLIGYSVDTDILLTTKCLEKNEIKINEKIFRAFKTGMTMTLTSICAVTLALIVVRSFSAVLAQIFTVLIIGLSFDIFNTWVTNASIIKWYLEKNEI